MIGHLYRVGNEIELSFLIPDEKHWSRWRPQVKVQVDQWLSAAGDVKAGWDQLMSLAEMEPESDQRILLEYRPVSADDSGQNDQGEANDGKES